MDRHDVEFEARCAIDDRGAKTLRHDIVAQTREYQGEWLADVLGPVRHLWPVDPDEAERAVPALEAELLVHVWNEILMAQDFNQAAIPSGTSDAATHNRDAAHGEAPLLAGEITLRPERPDDAGFLSALFRSAAPLAAMPVDDAVKETLLRMQFASQIATYRSQYPRARFDIVEQRGRPIGRMVVDPGGETGCIVDFALLRECRGQGLGSVILAVVLARFAELGRSVRCNVLAQNEASLRMCRRVGFVQIDAIAPFVQLEWRPPKTDMPAGADART
jgi:RimJ/RimL family protein N-acetyltransferase